MRNLSLILASLLVASVANAAPSTEILPSGVIVSKANTTEGKAPTAESVVKVMYRGTLPEGTEFDSSYEKNVARSFPLNRVISCWSQGLQKMHVGEAATLTCPADTAYGAAGIPGFIPPNTQLTFKVELLDVQ